MGQGASVDLLVADLAAEFEGRPCEVVPLGGGWMLRMRPAYAPAIRPAAAAGASVPAGPDLRESELAVLAAIARHQPIGRAGLAEFFGREIGRDLLGRLAGHGLIAPGPRQTRRGPSPGPASRACLPSPRTIQSLATRGDQWPG